MRYTPAHKRPDIGYVIGDYVYHVQYDYMIGRVVSIDWRNIATDRRQFYSVKIEANNGYSYIQFHTEFIYDTQQNRKEKLKTLLK